MAEKIKTYYVFQVPPFTKPGEKPRLFRVEGRLGASGNVKMVKRYSLFSFRVIVPLANLATQPEIALARYRKELERQIGELENKLKSTRERLEVCPTTPGDANDAPA